MSQCSNFFTSEDYAEYILRNGDFTIREIEKEKDYCYFPLNEKWLLTSFRLPDLGMPTGELLRYPVLSKLYGLSDLSAVNASGVNFVRLQPVLDLYGQNTYVAIIDTGINWRHRAFIREDGSTRIKVYWDQETDRVFYEADINEALRGEGSDIPGDNEGHGTFLSGVACGGIDGENSFSGVAPDAGLIVVRLKPAKKYLRDFYLLKDGAVAYAESDIVRAISFVSDFARQQELLVSYVIGVGTSLGFHDQGSPLGDILEDEAGITGRCVTIAGGNEGNFGLHYEGRLEKDAVQTVEIRVGEKEKGFCCELWSLAPDSFIVEIISPTGQVVNRAPGKNGKSTLLSFPFENSTVELYYLFFDVYTGQNMIFMRFINPGAGVWRLNIYSYNFFSGKYDIWIMNKSFLQEDTFFLSASPYTTITNPGNSHSPITVSAYNHRDNSLYEENSRGNTSYGIQKPDFSAPGVGVIGPDAFSTDGYVAKSGSSVAAAFVGGMGALLLEYGMVRGNIPYMRTSEIKNLLINGCLRKNGIVYPNREWGYGTVNLYESFEIYRQNV